MKEIFQQKKSEQTEHQLRTYNLFKKRLEEFAGKKQDVQEEKQRKQRNHHLITEQIVSNLNQSYTQLQLNPDPAHHIHLTVAQAAVCRTKEVC